MKLYRIALILLLGLLPQAGQSQGHEIFDGFVILKEAASGNTFFDTDLPTSNPDFTNIVVTIAEGDSLLIGGEVESSWGFLMEPLQADSAAIHYSVDGAGFAQLDLPPVVTGPPTDQWQQGNPLDMAEIGSSLAIGVHTAAVYFTATDSNHPLAPGLTKRLPETGAFTGLIDVVMAPTNLPGVAADDASDPAYAAGWLTGTDGGTGFGPWTFLTSIVGDGDAAGPFLAVNDPGLVDNDDLNGIGSGVPPKAWGAFANEGTTGGDDIQLFGAYRAFDVPLVSGQVFRVRIEHGDIQDGSLSANFPPRTGGWVGFALRSNGPGLQFDPDPISAFGGLQNAKFAFGFRGGQSDYFAYDVISPSGFSTGVPFTPDGVEVAYTVTGPDSYDLAITPLSPGGATTLIQNRTTTAGALAYLALYNRNAEEDDVFFNSLQVTPVVAVATNKLAADDAADPAYDGPWTNGANGGYGFEPWSLFAADDGGAAGHFVATNPPNTDLNSIASDGRGWGLFANDNGVGGVQFASARRRFSGGALKAGQTVSAQLEHGGISGLNGEVKLVLVGTQTFPNPMGEIFTFRFSGGGTNYVYFDGTFGSNETGIPFTDAGLQLEFTVLEDVEPTPYDLTVRTLGTPSQSYSFSGVVDSAPKELFLQIRDVEVADVFLNRLCILPDPLDLDSDGMPNDWEIAVGTDPNQDDADEDPDVDFLSNVEEYVADTLPFVGTSVLRARAASLDPVAITFDSSTNRVYTLQYTDELSNPVWTNVPGAADQPGSGLGDVLSDTNPTPRDAYRLNVRLP